MPDVTQDALDTIFLEARTRNGWQAKPMPQALLEEIWNLARMGPTSANCQPLRVVFVSSEAAKQKLAPALSASNRAKTMSAPVTALFAYDLAFYELLPKLFPHDQSARSWFAGNEKTIQETAFRNGSLQGAYLMIVARGLGLDCGPMSGFDAAKLNAAFFPDGRYKSNFLCNIGYGDHSKLFNRSPRLAFEEVYRKLIAESPDAHTLHYNLGLICFKLGRMEDAESAFLKALELTQGNPKIHFYLGSIYERLQRYTTVPSPYTREHAEGFIEKSRGWWESGSEATWAIRDGDDVGPSGEAPDDVNHLVRRGAELSAWSHLDRTSAIDLPRIASIHQIKEVHG